MEHMYDRSAKVQQRDMRGISTQDIPGAVPKSKIKGFSVRQDVYERARPIRPRINDYDIINPYAGQGDQMDYTDRQMADAQLIQNGRRVLATGKQPRAVSPMDVAAGVKVIAKEGQGSITQCWPADMLEQSFNPKGRSLEAKDICVKNENRRKAKLRQADQEMMERAMIARIENSPKRPTYKNHSSVFGHLQDDPSTRQKRVQYQQITKPVASNGGVTAEDMIAMDEYNKRMFLEGMTAQEEAQKNFDQIELNSNYQYMQQQQPPQMDEQAISAALMRQGGKNTQKKFLSLEEGKSRIYGVVESDEQKRMAAYEAQMQRKGKRVMTGPAAANDLLA